MADDFNPYSAPQTSGQAPNDEGSGLKSLGQEARKGNLKQARTTMIVIGVLMMAIHYFAYTKMQDQIKDLERQGFAIDTDLVTTNTIILFAFVGVGALFIVMGIAIYKQPVPITIAAFVLYLICTIVYFINLQEGIGFLAIVIRVAILAAFWNAIQSAKAYEQERRMAPYGEF